jgi:quercetin dioxygenase-like cupin family protein
VFKGRLTVRYASQEIFEAGDAFYMPPGHAPAAEAGTEFVQISAADQLAKVEAAIPQVMRAGR